MHENNASDNRAHSVVPVKFCCCCTDVPTWQGKKEDGCSDPPWCHPKANIPPILGGAFPQRQGLTLSLWLVILYNPNLCTPIDSRNQLSGPVSLPFQLLLSHVLRAVAPKSCMSVLGLPTWLI